MTGALRFAVTGVALLIVQAGVWWVNRGFIPARVTLPESIAIPDAMGSWTGQEANLDPRLIRSIKADQMLNRTYQGEFGDSISLHVARWASVEDLTPHLPTICYTQNGWGIKKSESMKISLGKGRSLMSSALLLEQGGQHVQVLYWYQLGPHAYVDRDSARAAARKYWGQPERPGVTKVLLHRFVTSAEAPNQSLCDFARDVATSLDPAEPKAAVAAARGATKSP